MALPQYPLPNLIPFREVKVANQDVGAWIVSMSEILDQVGNLNVGEFTAVHGLPGAVRLSRFPARLEPHYRTGGGKIASRHSTGCELRLVPSGSHLVFRISSPEGAKVHAFQGDFWRQALEMKAGRVYEFHVELSERLKQLPDSSRTGCRFSPGVVRLVVERGSLYLHAVDSCGFPFRKPEASELPSIRWLAYGSSITQCDTYGYIFAAADRLGVDVMNKGMSGSCGVEAETIEFIANECSWDFMTCEWGVNIRGSVKPEEFKRRVVRALDILMESGKPVFLITVFPNGCRLDDTEPLNLEREEAYDEILRAEVIRRSHPKLQLIEGRDVLRSTAWLGGDLVHPTHPGHSRMGECLAELLRERLKGE